MKKGLNLESAMRKVYRMVAERKALGYPMEAEMLIHDVAVANNLNEETMINYYFGF